MIKLKYTACCHNGNKNREIHIWGGAMIEQRLFNRLEDFILLARRGGGIDLTVELEKRLFTRKFGPYMGGEPEDEIDMYILAAEYDFVVEGKTYEVTKFYAFGTEGELPNTARREIAVANERLKMDYKRLKEANIVFSEKFWD